MSQARVAIPDAVQLAQDGRQGAGGGASRTRAYPKPGAPRARPKSRGAALPPSSIENVAAGSLSSRRAAACPQPPCSPMPTKPPRYGKQIKRSCSARSRRARPNLEPVGLPSEAPQECQFGRAVHELVVGVPLLLVACSERHRAHQRQLEREPRHVLGAAGPRSEVGRLLRESRHRAPASTSVLSTNITSGSDSVAALSAASRSSSSNTPSKCLSQVEAEAFLCTTTSARPRSSNSSL